jgi:hypothetical protein
MDFGTHALLKEYLGDFDEGHPLLIAFDLNAEYMNYVDNLLKELDGRPNLAMKIEDMKNISNWQSVFSELEFACILKELNPEFVKTERDSPTPDIKVSLLGKDVFFEVKMLLENDETQRVYHEIWKIESDFVVTLNLAVIDKKRADRLIEFIKGKICAKEVGTYSYEATRALELELLS